MFLCVFLQSSQTAFQEQHINGPDLGDEDLLFINVQDGMDDGIDGMQVCYINDKRTFSSHFLFFQLT